MTDHAKRLAEIEAILAAAPVYLDAQQTARMHAALTPLLAEMKRVQAENSMFSGAMDWMMRTIAEALIEAGETPSPLADELTKQAAAKVREAGAASEALDALGVAPGSLADRVRALVDRMTPKDGPATRVAMLGLNPTEEQIAAAIRGDEGWDEP